MVFLQILTFFCAICHFFSFHRQRVHHVTCQWKSSDLQWSASIESAVTCLLNERPAKSWPPSCWPPLFSSSRLSYGVWHSCVLVVKLPLLKTQRDRVKIWMTQLPSSHWSTFKQKLQRKVNKKDSPTRTSVIVVSRVLVYAHEHFSLSLFFFLSLSLAADEREREEKHELTEQNC